MSLEVVRQGESLGQVIGPEVAIAVGRLSSLVTELSGDIKTLQSRKADAVTELTRLLEIMASTNALIHVVSATSTVFEGHDRVRHSFVDWSDIPMRVRVPSGEYVVEQPSDEHIRGVLLNPVDSAWLERLDLRTRAVAIDADSGIVMSIPADSSTHTPELATPTAQ